MSYSLTCKTNSVTLAPATPVLLLSLNPGRRLLMFEVTGVNPATFKFQSAPSSATDGMTLDAASISGGQGGSFLLGDDGKTINGLCPIDAVYTYSALGTTVTAMEGTVASFL